eukprot:g11971.t1
MHGADYAAEAAERVKVIQAEAEELLSEINRETEIKRQQIEDEQLELQSGHAAKIQELQLEIRAVRDDADERIHKIEQEMLVHQSSIEDEVLQKSAERSEALKAIREEAHEMSSLADEEYQKSLDQEVEAHERARKEMMDLEDERSRKVEEIEQSCQLWITAFNQRLEQTQADLASRVEHLVGSPFHCAEFGQHGVGLCDLASPEWTDDCSLDAQSCDAGLSNIAWDFATSSACEQTLFESAALAAEKRILELSFQNLANISQTFATAQARSMPLFAAVATRVSETEIDIEQEQGLANLVFLDAIIAKLEVLQFTVQGVANAAQALAELQCQSTIMRNLLQSAVERLKLIDVAKEVETDDLPSVKAVLSLAHALAFWDLLTSEAGDKTEPV